MQRCFHMCKISISYSYRRHWFGANILPQNSLVKCLGTYKIRQCYTPKPLRYFGGNTAAKGLLHFILVDEVNFRERKRVVFNIFSSPRKCKVLSTALLFRKNIDRCNNVKL